MLSTIIMKPIPLEEHQKEFKKQSSIVNKECATLSSGSTKPLAIANINLTHVFFGEVKHHRGSFTIKISSC